MKKIIIILVVLVVLVVIVFTFGIYKFNFLKNYINYQNSQLINSHDGTYTIDGQQITLKDGISETEAAPGSASKIITRYFGNELKHDLNDDGRIDSVFIITQESGGSGLFYYVVARLNTADGPLGSDGVLLGDRIAPQTIEIDKGKTAQGTNRQNVIVVNYAVRAQDEPFTTPPSIGKSLWLKLDPATMQFGIVDQPTQDNLSLTDGQQCYTYDHKATTREPYTVTEFIDINISGTKVTGTKTGTQKGPDMTNGYTGSITGTLDNNVITDIFSYVIEGSKNKEQEIYRTSKIGIEKMRYPLIEKAGMLVPDTTKTFTAMSYARVGCLASN